MTLQEEDQNGNKPSKEILKLIPGDPWKVRVPVGAITEDSYQEWTFKGAFLTDLECRLIIQHTVEEQDLYDTTIDKIKKASVKY